MSQYVFGVDVGGMSIKLGLFQKNGELVEKFSIETDIGDEGRRILPAVAQGIFEKLGSRGLSINDVSGVGVGVPSPVTDDGVALFGTNINWRDPIPVKEILHELLDVPVYVTNDANLAALGELWQGGASGKKSMILLTLGTGVGGGIVIDEKVINGANGTSGEVGHFLVVSENGAPCGCGRIGCLETVASATGILRLAKEQLATFEGESILKNIEDMGVKDVFDAALTGDVFSVDLVDQVGHYLGLTCVNLALTVNPEVFILGGGVSQAGDVLLEAVRKHYKIHAFSSVKDTPFKLAILGNDAGIVGGAYLAMVGKK